MFEESNKLIYKAYGNEAVFSLDSKGNLTVDLESSTAAPDDYDECTVVLPAAESLRLYFFLQAQLTKVFLK